MKIVFPFAFVVTGLLAYTNSNADVFIDTTRGAVSNIDGAANNFTNSNLTAAGIAQIAPDIRPRTITRLSFVVGIRTSGTPNVGNLDGYQFLLAKVIDPLEFNVIDFETAYIAGEEYKNVPDSMFFDTPSNFDFSTPYDTSGVYHLHCLEFDNLSFQIEPETSGFITLIGLNQIGDGSAITFQFTTDQAPVGLFDAGFDPRDAVYNPDFPAPFPAYAFQACGEFSAGLLGDVNRDGEVDLLDIAPFVDLLTAGEFQIEADINQDKQVDLLDVAPFVELLAGA